MFGSYRSSGEGFDRRAADRQLEGGDAAAIATNAAAQLGDTSERPSSGFPARFDLASLDGSNGVRLDGIDDYDRSGTSVSSAGDINGDGLDDVIIGALNANGARGESYVVFGRMDGIPASLDLADLNGMNGFTVSGVDGNDSAGRSVSSAGDVNGDGIDDIIIGAYFADPGGDSTAGESYVVFGKTGGFAANLELSTLDGTNGFRLDGIDAGDQSGYSVSGAGDVNGDGFDDIIIGALGAGAGESYVVFGQAGGHGGKLDLSALDGGNGFTLVSGNRLGTAGRSVSSAGDVNNDGYDDIIIGDNFAGRTAGASYVVFGKASGFDASVDLSTLDGTNGFRIDGVKAGDYSGWSVSDAGDVNGDGFDDVVIGAWQAEPGGAFRTGESYVVFGKESGFAPRLDLATLDGTNGFRLIGVRFSDYTGYSVSSAGDVNGDGFDDVIIGAYGASPGRFAAGESYVVFGKAGGHGGEIDLATLDGTNGFRLDGVDEGDNSGRSVSAAGDVNGDGFDDIIIGSNTPIISNGRGDPGRSYVVFGVAPTEAVERIGSAAAQTIRGGDFDDFLNGKGHGDTLAGGGGMDELRGGTGRDDFLFASTNARDADTILDFGRGDDRIALDGGVFGLTEGDLAPSRFIIGDAAQDGNDRLIYDDTTGNLFFDADGTGAQAQVLIATLTDAPPLAASDIVVI